MNTEQQKQEIMNTISAHEINRDQWRTIFGLLGGEFGKDAISISLESASAEQTRSAYLEIMRITKQGHREKGESIREVLYDIVNHCVRAFEAATNKQPFLESRDELMNASEHTIIGLFESDELIWKRLNSFAGRGHAVAWTVAKVESGQVLYATSAKFESHEFVPDESKAVTFENLGGAVDCAIGLACSGSRPVGLLTGARGLYFPTLLGYFREQSDLIARQAELNDEPITE